jgi:hypothetical protein
MEIIKPVPTLSRIQHILFECANIFVKADRNKLNNHYNQRTLITAKRCLFGMSRRDSTMNLELNHLSLPLFVTSQFEVLAALKGNLFTELAFRAFHPQNNLFGGLGLWIGKISCLKQVVSVVIV